jgi:uncharacterized membrane protein YqjE
MSTNGRTRSEQPGVANSVSELTHNAIELAELQAKLFSLDVKETSQNTGISIGLVICSVCILLGSVPVLLIALALALHELLDWSPAVSYAVAALIGILISVGIAAAAWTQFRRGIATMKRSREELSRNIAWLKSNLRNRGQASTSSLNDNN